VLDRLRTGEVTVVLNAALLTEGFDEPSVSCVVVATPHPRWRRAPMNDAQASLLRRLGITPPDAASKGDASDLITLARGAALLDRLTREAA
jgi:hypothetical protein